MLNCGWDTETYLIGPPDNMIPRIVCGSWDMAPELQHRSDQTSVLGTGEPYDLLDQSYNMWDSAHRSQARVIVHHAAFDVCVALRHSQDVMAGAIPGTKDKAEALYQLIWATLEKSLDNEWGGGPVLVSDTMLREQLYNLSDHGSIVANRFGKEIRYGLADLAYRHLGIDKRAKKVKLGPNGRILDINGKDITGTPEAGEAWRLRYSELDGIPISRWPTEAYTYALDDATMARLIWDSQERKTLKATNQGHRTIRSEALQVYSSVCLQLITATGFVLDRAQVKRVDDEILGELAKVEPTLRANGFMRSNGSVNKKIVQDLVEDVCRHQKLTIQRTETDQIATGKEIMQLVAPFDPRLEAFARRQILAKLRDAFLPALQGEKVWTTFDTLKETGRTSSRGSSTRGGRTPLFPAVNCQQIPRRDGIRDCFLAGTPGHLMASVDYSALELCSVAQTTHWLMQAMKKGVSVHREKINAGYDLHSYLGSGIAALKEPELVGHVPLSLENMDTIYNNIMVNLKYRAPKGYQQGDSEIDHRIHLAKRAKHFRTFAKPTGLGYPGGLGPDTMVIYARATYGVHMAREDAVEMKELWFTVYPEMKEYFAWVRGQLDLDFGKKEDGEVRYGYVTPGFNRFRAGCFYCAAANGAAMQSLSADGAKRSVCWLGRAIAGGLPPDSPFRILDKGYHQAFIHDENIVAFPDDHAVTERSFAASQLMCQAMQVHMPDVRISAEPALMTRWSKAAEPEWVEDPQGQEKAWYQLASEYGQDLATVMMKMFSPKDGRRLIPFDRSAS